MLTVYLDNADYSRIADFLASRGEAVVGEVLQKLVSMRDAGKIQIVYSMAILSELIRYEGGGRELALRKARALNFLCQGRTFRHHSRLLAMQVADVAVASGLVKRRRLRAYPPVSLSNGWYPAIGSIADDLGVKARDDLIAEFSARLRLNRKGRKGLEAKIRTTDFQVLVNQNPDFVDRLVDQYSLDRNTISQILPKYLERRISQESFEAKMYAEMANPEKFVIIYYEKYSGDHTMLEWMKDLGSSIYTAMTQLREKNAERDLSDSVRRPIRRQLESQTLNFARRMVESLGDETAEIGLDMPTVKRLASDDNLLLQVAYFEFLSKVLPVYVLENAGLYVRGRSPSHSDGGDIADAIHIPFSDLWRGDGYFADLLRRAVPNTKCLIVPRLADLPSAIEQELAKAAASTG